MATTGGNWTGGNPPKNFAHTPAPKPLNAVAASESEVHGNLSINRVVGEPLAENVVIYINGRNLVDIIAELQAAEPTAP